MKKLMLSTAIMLAMTFAKGSVPFQFVSPLPNSKLVNIEHNIIIRQGDALLRSTVRISEFIIEGNKSGKHEFSIRISSDGKTINLDPLTAFAFGEVVTVTIKEGIKTSSGNQVGSFEFSFTTHREFTSEEKSQIDRQKKMSLPEEMNLKLAVPTSNDETRNVDGLLKININSNPSPGEIFFDAVSANSQRSKYSGYQIVSTDGDSLFQRRLDVVYDFKLQGNGNFSVFHAYDYFDVLDSNFNVIDQIYAANGYRMDGHEMLITPENHYFIIADEYQFVNMTVYNPDYSPNALVNGTVIQEFDENKTLLFEWRSFDHVEITEALHVNLAASGIDYIHTNSLEIDLDGNIIASHRHLSQITKIDRNTGEFIWRLGGINNEFTFTNDTAQFSYQHDARRLANGDILLFDNGNFHYPAQTFVKEYQLDETNKTATLTWSYSHPNEGGGYNFSPAMGSAQRLDDGNTFVNWGWRSDSEAPSMSEVTPEGKIDWEATLTDKKNMVSYRAHKYEYHACARPTYSKMGAQNITPTSAMLRWFPAWGAVKYELQYSKLPEGAWQQETINGSNLKKMISALEPNSVYQWKLKTWCDEDGTITSGFTEVKKFRTPPMRTTLVGSSGNEILLYPNPASDIVTIESGDGVISEIRILNMLEQEIFYHSNLDNVPYRRIELSLKTIPAGNYVVEVIEDDQQKIKRLVVE